jgi:hypothetical protein
MAKYRALRGVCIGVDRILSPESDPVELDASTAQFLTSIGAVAKVEEPAPPAPDAPPADSGQVEPAKPIKDAKASKKGT